MADMCIIIIHQTCKNDIANRNSTKNQNQKKGALSIHTTTFIKGNVNIEIKYLKYCNVIFSFDNFIRSVFSYLLVPLPGVICTSYLCLKNWYKSLARCSDRLAFFWRRPTELVITSCTLAKFLSRVSARG